MAIPAVAIIGRPNVGKSSLLNALAGRRISIVEPTAGVTRDRISALVERDGRYVELIDTGGYGVVDTEELAAHIEKQITQAIASAELVVFMVDVREGLTPLDEKIARMLRRRGMEVIGVANKADTAKMFPAAGEFSRLGFGDFRCISTTNNLNKQVLLDEIFERLEQAEQQAPPETVMKLAIVGKRNAGKSTFLNAVVGSERVIVNEVPGTTRDAVDVRFDRDGRGILLIDTAGIRKKSKISDSIEFYGYVRATEAVRRADVVLFMIDATLPISRVDKKLARLINQEYKTCIIVVNKWDLAEGKAAAADYEEYLTRTLAAVKTVPIAFTVATRRQNIEGVLDLAEELFAQATTQIPTSKLNKAIEYINERRGRAGRQGKAARPKIYYATQIAVNPITILMFVNKPELFDNRLMRYITSSLQEILVIEEVPVRLLARARR